MKLATMLLAALVVTGCNHTPRHSTGMSRYTQYAEPTSSRSLVTVRWMDDLSVMCGAGTQPRDKKYLGCAYSMRQSGNCLVFAKKPKDFNDHEALAVLGHELMHCLGASHEDKL